MQACVVISMAADAMAINLTAYCLAMGQVSACRAFMPD